MMTAIFRRLCLSVLILFMVAVFVFMATEVLPGDALDAILTADDLATMEPEQIEEMRRDLGLDKPAAVRFWTTIRAGSMPPYGAFAARSRMRRPSTSVNNVYGYPRTIVRRMNSWRPWGGAHPSTAASRRAG